MVERIRTLCVKNDISLNRLEKECGLSGGTINKWNRNMPSADKLAAVADYFCVSMEYLLTGKEKQPPVSEELSEVALAIARIVDSLPEENRRLLLAQVKAVKQATEGQDDLPK